MDLDLHHAVAVMARVVVVVVAVLVHEEMAAKAKVELEAATEAEEEEEEEEDITAIEYDEQPIILQHKSRVWIKQLLQKPVESLSRKRKRRGSKKLLLLDSMPMVKQKNLIAVISVQNLSDTMHWGLAAIGRVTYVV